MLAINILGWQLQYWQIWLPVLVGVASGGLCLVVYRMFLSRPVVTAPPPRAAQKPSQEYDPFVQGSPTEQRKAHRRGGNPVEVWVSPSEDRKNPQRGWVVDRSVGGLCIALGNEISAGAILHVLPVNAPNITPWTEVVVRSCRPSKDGYENGCEFVRQPTWSVLLLFG